MRRHDPAHVRNWQVANRFAARPRARNFGEAGSPRSTQRRLRGRAAVGLVALGAVLLVTSGCGAGDNSQASDAGPLLTKQGTWNIANAGKVETISSLWVSANDQWAFWQHDDQLAVIDLTSRSVVRSYPADAAVASPDLTRVYALDGDRVRVIDADTAEVVDDFPIDLPELLAKPVMSLDGATILTSVNTDKESIGVVDVEARASSTVVLPSSACRGVVGPYLSGEGSLLFVSGTYSEDRGCPRGGGISRISLSDPPVVEAQIPVPIDDPDSDSGNDVLTMGDPGLSALTGDDLFVITDPVTGFECSMCARGVEGAWPTKISAIDTTTNTLSYSVPIEPAIKSFVVAPKTGRVYTMGVDITAVSMDAKRVEGSVDLDSDDIQAIAVNSSESALYALTEGRGGTHAITVLGP